MKLLWGVIIKWMKTGNLKGIIFITFLMLLEIFRPLLALIQNSFSYLQTDEVKNFILKLEDYRIIVTTIIPSYFRYLIIILLTLIWGCIVYFRIKDNKKLKSSIFILGHSTLGKTQFKLSDELSREYDASIIEIDYTDHMNKIGTNYENINSIVCIQDSDINKFKSNINDNDEFGYMGIAHTPLILRAGYKIGDETRFSVFHKKRKNAFYEALNSNKSYSKMQVEKIDIKDGFDELIVAISTTFLISDDQLEVLQPKGKSILKFKSDDMGFDIIISNNQIDEYIDYILKKLRDVVKENNINKIHMVISSSVAFTFALGQAFSSNYDPEIIIYHYQRNSLVMYPWGISLFKGYNECIVVN